AKVVTTSSPPTLSVSVSQASSSRARTKPLTSNLPKNEEAALRQSRNRVQELYIPESIQESILSQSISLAPRVPWKMSRTLPEPRARHRPAGWTQPIYRLDGDNGSESTLRLRPFVENLQASSSPPGRD